MAVIPPMLLEGASYQDWIYRALSFLVVSCPCALVVSIPLSFFGGLGGASRKGVLIKGSNYLEAMAQAEIVVFDKTGTLTKGVFKVQNVTSKIMPSEELLMLTAFAENYSNHPISVSLRQAYGKEIDNSAISSVEEVSGHGVIAQVMGRTVAAGNGKLMASLNVPYDFQEEFGTVVHVAVDGNYAGYIVITDEVKEDAAKAINDLKRTGIQTVMLTGDNRVVAEKIAEELGLDKVYSELLPGEKVEKLEEIFVQKTEKGKIAFVGDGINDAPVLARADIGVAMGGLGSDAAIEAADIVIMTDEPSRLLTAIKISKKTIRIAHQNIVFAIGIKALVLLLSAAGITTMWAAVFADVGVTVLAVINSFRALQVKKL
jgi:Cd2+/Zn2+-exporting ATPase